MPEYFVTHFVRKDESPCEDYYYQTVFEAIDHMKLFEDDDSDLYDSIQVIDDQTGKILREIKF